MKDMAKKLELLLEKEFEEQESLLKQEDIIALEESLSELTAEAKKGYTIPQLDTVGMNLTGKLSYSFKGY